MKSERFKVQVGIDDPLLSLKMGGREKNMGDFYKVKQRLLQSSPQPTASKETGI